MRTNKQYFLYYIKDNVLVFDIFDYIEELLADYVDYCQEWMLLKDNKVSSKPNIFNTFINQSIELGLMTMKKKEKELNCKILCYFNEKSELNAWSNYYSDPLKRIQKVKSVLSKRLPSFIKIKDNRRPFQDVKGTFNGLPCIIPTGEDEEFLIKIKKKLS